MALCLSLPCSCQVCPQASTTASEDGGCLAPTSVNELVRFRKEVQGGGETDPKVADSGLLHAD